MKQELSDVPDTESQARRQKGPIPMTAVFLAIGLAAVFILFFFPVFFE